MKNKANLIPNGKIVEELLENISDSVIIIDENKNILKVSKHISKLLGYSLSEFIGANIIKFIHQQSIDQKNHSFLSITTNNSLPILINLINKEGVEKPFNCTINCLQNKTYLLYLSDLSKNTVKDVEEINNELFEVVEHISKVGGWEYDLLNEQVYWTKETYQIHDFPIDLNDKDAKIYINKSLECYSPEDKTKVQEAFEKCVNYGIEYDLICRLVTLKKRRLWIRTMGKPIYENGKIIKVVGNIIDITDRKREDLLSEARFNLVQYSYKSNLDEFLIKFIDEAERLTESKIGFYHFVNDNQKSLTLQIWSTRTQQNYCNAKGKGLHYNIDQAGVWVECFHTKTPVIHNNYNQLKNKKGMPEGHAIVTREMVIPLIRNSKVVSILGVGNKETDYDQNDIEIASKLADLAWDITARKIADEIILKNEEYLKKRNIEIEQKNDELIKARSETLNIIKNLSLEIEERKRTEQALKESEEKIQSIFRVIPTGMGVVKDKIIIEVNPKICEMTGYTKDELIGQNSLILYPSQTEYNRDEIENYTQFIKNGTSVVETLWKRKDGMLINIMLSTTPLFSNNISYGVTFTALDITKRKQAEYDLKTSEKKFRDLFISHSAVKLLVDPVTLTILDANDSALTFFGWSIDKLKSINFYNLCMDLSNSLSKDLLSAKIKEKNYFETKQKKADGTIVYVEIYSSAVKIEDKDVLHMIIHDVSEKKRTELEVEKYRKHLEDLVKERTEKLDKLNMDLVFQLQKEKELESQLEETLSKEKEISSLKTKFIATVSHEFRTPLSALLSSIQLIQKYGPKWNQEKLDEQYSRIDATIKYFTQLLDDVLMISRVDREIIKNIPEPIDVKKTINSFVEEVKSNLTAKHHLEIKYYTNKNIINIDKKIFHQIITNLLNNSIKYSPAGGKIELQIRIENENMLISVSDEGMGIPEDESKYVFDAFYRTKNSAGITGSGLGLNIVKRCIDFVGGNISFESEVNKGTIFTLTFPLTNN